MIHSPIFFEDTLRIVQETFVDHSVRGIFTIVRDIRGKIRILLEKRGDLQGKQLKTLCEDLYKRLGVYAYEPEAMLLYKKDLIFNPDITLERLPLDRNQNQNKELTLYLLDRQIIGQDWLRPPFTRNTRTQRVTFFGIKGGVGRSTALILWAWMLAKEGKRVLLFDLDLESPGISQLLLPGDALPDFGIIDWFIEDGLQQGEPILQSLSTSSPIATNLRGEILVVPAYGKKTGAYIPKLARCYSPIPQNPSATWGERLHRFVSTLEQQLSPDITLLDSRSGIHDIAAVTVTRMGATAFLFAVDSPQTWQAYNFLFDYIKQHPSIRDIRKNLQIVASLIPETGREAYLDNFVTHSWDTFRDNLYDDTQIIKDNTTEFEAFSFDKNDEDAPHWPLTIFWHRALQEFNPCTGGRGKGIDESVVFDALNQFNIGALGLINAGHME